VAARKTEQVTLHFRLGKLPSTSEFHLAAGRRRIPLIAHTPETMEAHSKKNRALAALSPETRAGFTHYVENAELPSDVAMLLRVEYASGDAHKSLPELAALHIHIPRQARYEHRRQKIDRGEITYPPRRPRPRISSDEEREKIVQESLDADSLITSQSTAAAILFQHPQLATSDPKIATIVVDDHINSPQNAINMSRFGGVIHSQGSNWQTQGPSTTYKGQQLDWSPKFSNQSGPVQAYQISQTTYQAAAAPLSLPLATSRNDASLQNTVWTLNPGTPSTPAAQTNQRLTTAPNPGPRMAVETPIDGYDFSLANNTPGYGLSIDGDSIQFTPGSAPGTGTMSINSMNSYLRSLYAWVKFEDDGGNPVSEYESVSLVTPVNVVLGIPMPTDPTTLTFDWPASASKAVLAHAGLGTSNWDNDIVWPGVLMTGIFNYGIPILFLVAGALLDGDGELNELEKDEGIQKTVQDLGMSIFGAVETNSIGFDNMKTILSAFADGMAGFLVHAGLESLQEWIVEQLTEAGLEDAIPYVDIVFQIANRAVDLVEIGETTVEVLLSPAVYTASISRSMPVELVVSPDPTHGSLGNPAIWPTDSAFYQAVLQYQGGTFFTENGPMLGASSSEPVTVPFNSVPAGGLVQGKFAVFAVDNTLLGQWSGSWVPAVPRGDGSTLTLSGSIQETLVPLTSNTVYNYKQKLVFNEAAQAHMWQPNEFSLQASEASNLNAGQIDSTVQQTFQTNGVTLSSGATVQVSNPGSIWNILDQGSTYNLSLVTESGVSFIQVSTFNAPVAVLPLNASDQGNNLGAVVDITINDRAYMLGYCWEASGQDVPVPPSPTPVTSQIYTFQNINVLSNPEASLKFSGAGFGNQPFLVYDQFGPEPLFTAPATDYENDLNNGVLDDGLRALFTQFGYALPTAVAVAVVTNSAEWTIGLQQQAGAAAGAATRSVSQSAPVPLYQLNRLTDQINIYPYPTPPVSQNNFYLDPVPISNSGASYRYQTRQVTLDNTTPFPIGSPLSFGQFLLPALTDVAVHPQGYLIGAHATLNVLEVLQLPSSPATDSQAVAAVIVGGQGVRAGLFNGPTSVAVTADGRVLVLEQGNARIQAVDVNGNPVYCFTGATVGSAPASALSGLDQGLVSTALRDVFSNAGYELSSIWRVQDGSNIYQLAASQSGITVTSAGSGLSNTWTITDSSSTPQVFTCTLNGAEIDVADSTGTKLFSVPASDLGTLNSGAVASDIYAGFAGQNISLTAPISVTGNGLSLPVSDVDSLAEGQVPSDLGPALSARGITLSESATVAANVVVKVNAAGSQWTLTDPAGPSTYEINAANGSGTIVQLAPFVPLQPGPGNAPLTYKCIGVELKGYIYTLGYTGDGTAVSDFLLDIYQPDGGFLSRTGGVNAGCVTVDMWRNVFTLNFESFLGPGGRTEPSVSTWTPSA
jgi:hypothetical protein